MIILPAIDIKDGTCVRLYQGDFGKVTTYDTDPVRVAQRWQEAGASWLHVVDLDGAARGYPVNVELIGHIRAATTLRIEVGGGMRALPHIKQALDLGIERIVLGTITLTDRALLEEALHRWVGVVLMYENAWWDNVAKSWVDEQFHVLDNVTLFDREKSRRKKTKTGERQTQLAFSTFIWNEVIFRSFKAGNLKSIDFEFWKGLERRQFRVAHCLCWRVALFECLAKGCKRFLLKSRE